MSTIRFTAEVLPNGTIRLPQNVQLVPGQAEVTVEQDPMGKQCSDWPVGYFDETAGKLAGEEFERPEQGDLPQRDAW